MCPESIEFSLQCINNMKNIRPNENESVAKLHLTLPYKMGIDLIAGAKTVVPAMKRTFLSSVSGDNHLESYLR